MQLLQLVEPVIERVHDVRGRASGHAAPDKTIVKHDDAATFAHGQSIRHRQPGDPRPDANIRARVFAERVQLAEFTGCFPKRDLVACAFRLVLMSGHMNLFDCEPLARCVFLERHGRTAALASGLNVSDSSLADFLRKDDRMHGD